MKEYVVVHCNLLSRASVLDYSRVSARLRAFVALGLLDSGQLIRFAELVQNFMSTEARLPTERVTDTTLIEGQPNVWELGAMAG